MAGAVPHSTPILTDGALNLDKSALDVNVTDTAIFLCLSTLLLNSIIVESQVTNTPNYDFFNSQKKRTSQFD